MEAYSYQMFLFAVSSNERTHTKEVKCLCNVEPFLQAFRNHDFLSKLNINVTQSYTLRFSNFSNFFSCCKYIIITKNISAFSVVIFNH